MKILTTVFATGLVLGAVLAGQLGGGPLTLVVAASQAVQSGESNSRVILENARVRVREVTFPPGVPMGMHTHALPHVGVVVQGGTLTLKYPDGKVETEKLAAGAAGFRDANVTHDPFNPGPSTVRVIEVELK